MSPTRKSSYTPHVTYGGRHRFEHWYRDNQVYFIIARCRDKLPLLEADRVKEIFWDRFEHYTQKYEFEPFIVTVLHNHYHFDGYCKIGKNLGPMMRQLHGSVAKLVNDTLPSRHVPFWHDRRHHDYFDGCLRNEKQLDLSWRYIWLQAVRAKIVHDPKEYAHTRVYVSREDSIRIAVERHALLYGVPYKRYLDGRRQGR